MAYLTKIVAGSATAAVIAAGGIAAVANLGAQTPNDSFAAVAAVTSTISVKVVADGETRTVSIVRPDVASALDAAGITLRDGDTVTPALASALKAGDTVTVQRVSTGTTTKTIIVPFATKKVEDSSLDRGVTKVKTEGVFGTKVEVIETKVVNGKSTTTVVSSTVTKQPVTRVILVGTKVAVDSRSTSRAAVKKTTTAKKTTTSKSTTTKKSTPAPAPEPATSSSGKAINLARAAMWDRIAQCESGGNWSINTGNGYYGGLQFNLRTWLGVGGADFARYPHQATRAEQITVANRLYAQRGLQPWGCRHAA